MTAAPNSGDDAQESPPPDPNAPLRAAITSIRARADLTAKAFASLATTAVTAVGIVKFGDVFPLPNNGWAYVAVLFVIAAFLGMGAAIAFFTSRLWRVAEPIVTRSDPALMADDLRDDKERSIVDAIYGEIAAMNSAPTLAVLEARGQRLARIADRLGAAGADATKGARDIEAGVQAAFARASLLIARHRASAAVTSASSLWMYLVFVVSFVAFGMASDYLESERSDRIAVVKACGEAETANKGAELPPICPSSSADSPPSPAPNPPREVTKTIRTLATRLARCTRAEGNLAATTCAPVRRALEAMLEH